MTPPTAMISYSRADEEAVEVLHDELALRCFRVVHDVHSFTEGSRIHTSMAAGVESCDVFVAYLTRDSLYLDRPPGEPRPALAGEFLPALERRRTNLAAGRIDCPIIIPLPHGLGDRAAAGETIRRVTGESVESLWRNHWLNQDTNRITQSEAADVADGALRAVLQGRPPSSPIELFVATRGTPSAPRRFTIDGTRLLGGDRRPGDPGDWARFAAALRSVRARLDEVAAGGTIRIDLSCHLSAALATGRMFHQATRWSPVFSTRHSDATPALDSRTTSLSGSLDRFGETGDLIVDIDLIGHGVAALTTKLAALLPVHGGRLSLSAQTEGDLSGPGISQLARDIAERVRSAHAALSPRRIHIAMAAPAAFAGLLGHHLTALQADITSYELGENGYQEAVTLPAVTP